MAGSSAPGALLDAVSRGMRAALVEQDDIAAGTSSRSSRLIHGGLRYLEQFRFGLVREALAERRRLLTLAPHLVRIEPLLFPIYGIPYRVEGVLRRRADPVRHPRRAPRRRLASPAVEGRHARPRPDAPARGPSRWPRLPRRGRGRRAVHAGRGPDRDRRRRRGASPGSGPPVSGRIRGRACSTALRAEDLATGADLEIRTRAVVDATGVWAAEPDHPFKGASLRILPSRGAHLVVPRDRIPNTIGPDHPGPGQDRLPRPVAGPLADRHDRRAVRRAGRATRRPPAGRSTGCSTRSTRRWTWT